MTGARGDDDILCFNPHRTIGGIDCAVPGVLESGPALDELGTRALQKSLHPQVQALDNRILPRHHRCHVDFGRATDREAHMSSV